MAKKSEVDKLEGIYGLNKLIEEADKIKPVTSKTKHDPKETILSDNGEVIKLNNKHPRL